MLDVKQGGVRFGGKHMASSEHCLGERAAALRASADNAYMRIARLNTVDGLEQREMRSILGLLERLIVDLEVVGAPEFSERRAKRNSDS